MPIRAVQPAAARPVSHQLGPKSASAPLPRAPPARPESAATRAPQTAAARPATQAVVHQGQAPAPAGAPDPAVSDTAVPGADALHGVGVRGVDAGGAEVCGVEIGGVDAGREEVGGVEVGGVEVGAVEVRGVGVRGVGVAQRAMWRARRAPAQSGTRTTVQVRGVPGVAEAASGRAPRRGSGGGTGCGEAPRGPIVLPAPRVKPGPRP
ncbi:hypothetical protein STRMOE7_23750 [Streptomyces sp. MOE7]|nr:hypothetical protein STRMOE7_23750 [Streptomyces sp. MOE7]